MKNDRLYQVVKVILILLICLISMSYTNKLSIVYPNSKTHSVIDLKTKESDNNSFIVIHNNPDKQKDVFLFSATRAAINHAGQFRLDSREQVFESDILFCRPDNLCLTVCKENNKEKNKLIALHYCFNLRKKNSPFEDYKQAIIKPSFGDAFYEWDSNAVREPTFYPSSDFQDTFIVDINLDKLNGIVNVFNYVHLGYDFFGNYSLKKYEDTPLNPLLSPIKNNIIVIFAGKQQTSIYLISNDRLLHENEVEWSNFIKKMKNHKNNQYINYLWKNLSAQQRKTINKLSTRQIPNKLSQTLIVRDMNRIISGREIFKSFLSKDNKIRQFGRKYYSLFVNVVPPQTSTYPIHIPKTTSLNRLFLEWAFPDSIKKSSIPRKIVSGYPIYYQEKGKGIRIPHKVWSPDGKSILFTGALEKAYCANVYAVDVKTRKITKILDVNDSSGSFNPDLEWTKNGMVITSGNGIFLRDVKITGGSPGVIHKLQLPDSISDMRYGKISPDGKQLFFIGKKDNQVFVFIYNFEDRSLMEERAGTGNDVSQYCGAWINPDKDTIIKNELEYQEFRGYEDLR
jgi:hypothetical protein